MIVCVVCDRLPPCVIVCSVCDRLPRLQSSAQRAIVCVVCDRLPRLQSSAQRAIVCSACDRLPRLQSSAQRAIVCVVFPGGNAEGCERSEADGAVCEVRRRVPARPERELGEGELLRQMLSAAGPEVTHAHGRTPRAPRTDGCTHAAAHVRPTTTTLHQAHRRDLSRPSF